jgi:hypothetical protein
MQRGNYLLRKSMIALLTLIIVIIFNFFLFRILPGDPARAVIAKGRMTPDTMERMRVQFGLDKPVWLDGKKLREGDISEALDSQFTAYVSNLFNGNRLVRHQIGSERNTEGQGLEDIHPVVYRRDSGYFLGFHIGGDCLLEEGIHH